MKKRGDYLKKAYYHLMKIEQKKNKIPARKRTALKNK